MLLDQQVMRKWALASRSLSRIRPTRHSSLIVIASPKADTNVSSEGHTSLTKIAVGAYELISACVFRLLMGKIAAE